ncbi:MAG: PAS domain-containing protein [Verrucomicrobia bacterium]|nr:PAS domain-containing protein [Verrucomicrobiota bacterium]
MTNSNAKAKPQMATPMAETDMCDLVIAFDWSKTALGPMKKWPQSLRFAVDLCLSSNIPMFIWWGPDLINIYNDAYAPILGNRHPDALGQPARKIWAEIWPDIGADVDRVVRDGVAVVKERVRFVMERNDYPEETYFTYSHSPIPDGRGGIAGLLQVCSDQTAYVRAEARDQFLLALDEATRPLSDPAEITATHARLLGEHLSAHRCAYADVESDQDTFNVTGDYNRGVPSIVGRYRFSDFGKEVLRLNRANKPYIAHDVETHRPPIGDLAAYRATMIRAVICVPLHKNGKFRAAMAVHQKFPRRWRTDEVELVRHVASRCWESIERARTEAALRESEEFHRFASEAGRTGSWYMQFETDEFVLSPMMAELMGFPVEHKRVPGEQWRDCVIPADRDALANAVCASIEHNIPFEIEFQIALKDGTERWLYSRGGVFRDSSGKALRLHGASVDITERKETERALAHAKAELEENNHQLESIVEERTARLRETIGELEAFSYSISHDMRSPLRAMQGFSQALVDEYAIQLNDEGKDLLRRIERGARRLDLLIQDVLAYSKVAKGEFQLLPVDLDTLIPEIIQSFNYQNTRITINHPLPKVMGHEPLITQIISNLVGNAVKFTVPGATPEVCIYGEPFDGMVRIWVQDDGIGIDPSHFKQIFVIFGRVYSNKQFEGTGIGLAIVKKAVERLGGQIGLESELVSGGKLI